MVVRLRNLFTGENGMMPELLIGAPFLDKQPRYLILTYDGSRLRAYVDQPERSYEFRMTPDALFFRLFSPRARVDCARGSRRRRDTEDLVL